MCRNIPECVLNTFFGKTFPSLSFVLESVPSGESQSVTGGDEDALDDYQELSTREEQDIESMMEMCEDAISNAEAFAEALSKELQVLDGVSEATAPSLSGNVPRKDSTQRL